MLQPCNVAMMNIKDIPALKMEIKDYILNLNSPVVIRNRLNDWKILNYSEKDWCDAFHDQKLTFRKGCKIHKKDPYWEQLCQKEEMTLNEFFKISKQESDNWLYYDYKYLKDVFQVDDSTLNEIKWESLGFGDLQNKDSTIWIGNQGAHTPCHMDTYGFNLVAQLYGRKLWILIPPEETQSLKPTRVPYEESSIYSSYNFYTPNQDFLKDIKALRIVLNPGDVLYVPRHWWHYVENLEIAISINIWVPVEEDHESRLQELLVRNYILNLCQELTKDEAVQLLNPNEYSLLQESFDHHTLSFFIENCKKYRKRKKDGKTLQKTKPEGIFEIDRFTTEEIKNYVQEKEKLRKESDTEDLSGKINIIKNLINSYCHPTNVKLIKETLLEL